MPYHMKIGSKNSLQYCNSVYNPRKVSGFCVKCVISDIPGGKAKGFGIEIYNYGKVAKESLMLNFSVKRLSLLATV